MKGITFEDIKTGQRLHTYNDLHLILLEGKEIGSPQVKIRKLDIEGADGSLDYTDFFGEPKYEDVTHKFPFAAIVPQSDFLSLFSTVKNAIHGMKMRVILDDDPLFYYVGRPYVSPLTSEKNVGSIIIECDCEPYKYKLDKTVVSKAVNGTQAITLKNSRKRTVPEITTTATMTISFDGWSVSHSAGTFTLPELELVEGENTVTVTGTGTIAFTYQEAGL